MNKNTKKFIGMVGFTFGTAFNIGILAALVIAAYNLTTRAYDFGKDFSDTFFTEKPYAEAEIVLEDGATLQEVSAILEEKGVIGNALMFQLENILKGNNTPYGAGSYILNSNMSVNAMNFALRQVIVETNDVRITIREGRSIKEIAEYLELNEIMSADAFIDVANTGDFRYGFLDDIPPRENRLEGYLFPDTYFISENAGPEEIIDKMLTRFEDIYDAETRAKAAEMGLTMDEVIIIASIIEKEIRRDDERELAASVIFNRLNIGMKLEMDATVLYALGVNKDRLLYTDLEIVSPYNTYMYHGLPAGPITNPGRACIDAALNPAETNYIYYVVKDPETGEHFFTSDYNEFLIAKELYTSQFDD